MHNKQFWTNTQLDIVSPTNIMITKTSSTTKNCFSLFFMQVPSDQYWCWTWVLICEVEKSRNIIFSPCHIQFQVMTWNGEISAPALRCTGQMMRLYEMFFCMKFAKVCRNLFMFKHKNVYILAETFRYLLDLTLNEFLIQAWGSKINIFICSFEPQRYNILNIWALSLQHSCFLNAIINCLQPGTISS